MIETTYSSLDVWFMNIKPDGGQKGYHEEESLAFCRKGGIIGLGWGIDKKVDSFDSIEFKKTHSHKSSDAVIRFTKEVEIGDYVWVYDKVEGMYYLCKVTSEWENKTKDEDNGSWDKSDIRWVRKAQWKKIPRGDIPGKITRNPHIKTISKCSVTDKDKIFLRLLFDEAIDRNSCNIEKLKALIGKNDELFECLDADEVEDVVCNYLQSKGWRLIKSKVAKSNPDFECEFRNSEGETAYPQVKSGNQSIGDSEVQKYRELAEMDKKSRIFLFSVSGNYGQLVENPVERVEVIKKEDFREYLVANLSEQASSLIKRLSIFLRE